MVVGEAVETNNREVERDPGYVKGAYNYSSGPGEIA